MRNATRTNAHHLNPLAPCSVKRRLSVSGPIQRPALPHNWGYRTVLEAMGRLNILRVSPGIREGLLTLRAVKETSWSALTCTGISHRCVAVAGHIPFVAALASLLTQEPPATAPATPDDAAAGHEQCDENGSDGDANFGAQREAVGVPIGVGEGSGLGSGEVHFGSRE